MRRTKIKVNGIFNLQYQAYSIPYLQKNKATPKKWMQPRDDIEKNLDL